MQNNSALAKSLYKQGLKSIFALKHPRPLHKKGFSDFEAESL